MSRELKVHWICDNCKKEEILKCARFDFSYPEGWLMKWANESQKTDKHFCCIKCAGEWEEKKANSEDVTTKDPHEKIMSVSEDEKIICEPAKILEREVSAEEFEKIILDDVARKLSRYRYWLTKKYGSSRLAIKKTNEGLSSAPHILREEGYVKGIEEALRLFDDRFNVRLEEKSEQNLESNPCPQ